MSDIQLVQLISRDRLGRRHGGRRGRLQDILTGLSAEQQSRLLDVVGSEIESQTRRRIAEEKKAPGGEAWAPWSEEYAARRPSRGGILELEGHLLDSITYEVGDAAVEVGSNLAYARRHQEGDEDDGGMPARPFVGLSAENERDLQRLVVDWLDREVA